ncbi:MAG: Hsp20/alpha crystallin family protein [Gemmataceae bacterium]
MTFRRDPFRELWNEFSRLSSDVNKTFSNRSDAFGPAMNVWTDEHHVYVESDLPGLDASKIDVTVTEGNRLSISGERSLPTANNAVWVRQERPVGTFTREFELPVVVDADRVQAKYESGVLKLTLPKSEAAKPRKIAVS